MQKKTKKNFENIWKAVNNIRSGTVKNGKTLDSIDRETKIPSFEDIAKSAITNLKEIGFSVKRVEPKKANCIVRVFRDDNLIYDKDIYWMYGTDTYLKTIVGMQSKYETIIDYSNFKVRQCFFQDEYTIFEPHFVDYYFKITKSKK